MTKGRQALGRGLHSQSPASGRASKPATQVPAVPRTTPGNGARRGPILDRKGGPDATGREARKYPRAELHVRARLSIAGDRTRSFEASLPTTNISVGGMFLESTFFLKLGTLLDVELELPQPVGRTVHARGQVVRVETLSADQTTGQSGFALRFTEYLDGSEVILATYFLAPLLRDFIQDYAKQHRLRASEDYVNHTADVLAAW